GPPPRPPARHASAVARGGATGPGRRAGRRAGAGQSPPPPPPPSPPPPPESPPPSLPLPPSPPSEPQPSLPPGSLSSLPLPRLVNHGRSQSTSEPTGSPPTTAGAVSERRERKRGAPVVSPMPNATAKK